MRFVLFFGGRPIGEADTGLLVALSPLAIRALCRPISPVGLNTGSGSPYFARWAQYGLLAAIARWAIRRLPGVALRYTLGCILAPLQGALFHPRPICHRC